MTPDPYATWRESMANEAAADQELRRTCVRKALDIPEEGMRDLNVKVERPVVSYPPQQPAEPKGFLGAKSILAAIAITGGGILGGIGLDRYFSRDKTTIGIEQPPIVIPKQPQRRYEIEGLPGE